VALAPARPEMIKAPFRAPVKPIVGAANPVLDRFQLRADCYASLDCSVSLTSSGG